MSQKVTDAIKKKIFDHGRGWCFTPKHFLDLDSDTGVRKALSRLQAKNTIRRLAQGLYDYPRLHEVLGLLPPKIEDIVQALCEKNAIRILPSGAYAANLVGLSEQVPNQIVFLTNGKDQTLKIGNMKIILKAASEKTLSASGKVGITIQALKNIGQEHLNPSTKSKIQRFLEGVSIQDLKDNLKYAPEWIRRFILELLKERTI